MSIVQVLYTDIFTFPLGTFIEESTAGTARQDLLERGPTERRRQGGQFVSLFGAWARPCARLGPGDGDMEG